MHHILYDDDTYAKWQPCCYNETSAVQHSNLTIIHIMDCCIDIDIAVASTQISAAMSAAVQDAHVHAPSHWLCTDESHPLRFQSLHSRPPRPENPPVIKIFSHHIKPEMWANAEHDGHPAEYRWHPLLNAAKFG